MKSELAIDRSKKIPNGAMPALENQLLKRLRNQFEDCSLVVRCAGSDGVIVYGDAKEARKTVEVILQETLESADDWFC
ncbi:TPA: DinI family protein [Enterobacter cloacae]|nr:DinI family protein [Enterobacter cloacae]